MTKEEIQKRVEALKREEEQRERARADRSNRPLKESERTDTECF